MAFKPSQRSSREADEVEINLTPVMNLMVVLIPLLLSSATFVKIGVIDLNLPPAVGTSVSQLEAPKESEKNLDLAITITDQGFFISSSLAILRNEKTNRPTIPTKENGDFDFQNLAKKLFEIKKQATNKFADTDKVVIQAEPDINYQLLVSTMDAARNIKVDNQNFPLFPIVSLAAGVI